MTALSFIMINVLRNPRRTLLTIFSLAFSVFLIITLEGLLGHLERFPALTGGATRLVCHGKASFLDRIPESHVAKIRGISGVAAATPYCFFGGSYKGLLPQYSFAQFAVDPDAVMNVIPEIQVVDPATGKARPELYDEFRKDRMGALAGLQLFQRYNWKLGDRITLEGMMYPADLELVLRGAFVTRAGAESDLLYLSFRTFDEAIGRPGSMTAVMLRAANLDDMGPVIDRIDTTFANSDHETLTETEQALRGHAMTMFGNLQFFVTSIGTAVAFTMLMVAANTASMTARERIVEIAIMKALGFESSHLLKFLLSEAALVALAGSVAGAMLSYASIPLLRSALPEGFFQRIFGNYQLPVWLPLSAIALGGAVGCAAAMVPSWNSTRKPIADMVRRVG